MYGEMCFFFYFFFFCGRLRSRSLSGFLRSCLYFWEKDWYKRWRGGAVLGRPWLLLLLSLVSCSTAAAVASVATYNTTPSATAAVAPVVRIASVSLLLRLLPIEKEREKERLHYMCLSPSSSSARSPSFFPPATVKSGPFFAQWRFSTDCRYELQWWKIRLCHRDRDKDGKSR